MSFSAFTCTLKLKAHSHLTQSLFTLIACYLPPGFSRRDLAREGDYKMHHVCVCACVHVCISVSCRFLQNYYSCIFLSIICPNQFSCLWKMFWFCGLRHKDKWVIAIVATLSKGLITQKQLELEFFSWNMLFSYFVLSYKMVHSLGFHCIP